ncbi:copper resistance D family protein [Meiothermus rufus]|uniref:copper resistance D family protein n=1 Tax=Meiothermus rufus TaxID=604332 RepID=UPI00041E361C|nr:CopD family protein [Meiothermus rufus]
MPHEHEATQSVLRAGLYLGVFCLLGAGIFARYLSPQAARRQRWRLWYMLSLGFLLASGASLYGTYHLAWMLGDPSLMGTYLLETTQGRLVLLRLGLLLGLLWFALGRLRWDRWLYPWLAAGLLFTLALSGHAAASLGQVLADLLHLGAGVVWGGALLALALVGPGTPREVVLKALERLSALGLAMVGLLSLAGAYLAWARLPSLDLLASTYGQRLLLKLALVALTLGLAVFHRWWFLPRYRAGGVLGLGTLGLEAALLVGVLLASGFLATTPPPAPAASRLIQIAEATPEGHWVGQLYSQAGIIHLYLDWRDDQGGLLSSGPTIVLKARREGLERTEAAQPFYRSQYHLALLVPKPGLWEVTVDLPGRRLAYTLWVSR